MRRNALYLLGVATITLGIGFTFHKLAIAACSGVAWDLNQPVCVTSIDQAPGSGSQMDGAFAFNLGTSVVHSGSGGAFTLFIGFLPFASSNMRANRQSITPGSFSISSTQAVYSTCAGKLDTNSSDGVFVAGTSSSDGAGACTDTWTVDVQALTQSCP